MPGHPYGYTLRRLDGADGCARCARFEPVGDGAGFCPVQRVNVRPGATPCVRFLRDLPSRERRVDEVVR